jgi:hypothetical protein
MARGETKFVKPLKDLLVRMPDTMTPLPEDGAEVEWNTYWRRRVRDGSVEIVPTSGPKATFRKTRDKEV